MFFAKVMWKTCWNFRKTSSAAKNWMSPKKCWTVCWSSSTHICSKKRYPLLLQVSRKARRVGHQAKSPCSTWAPSAFKTLKNWWVRFVDVLDMPRDTHQILQDLIIFFRLSSIWRNTLRRSVSVLTDYPCDRCQISFVVVLTPSGVWFLVVDNIFSDSRFSVFSRTILILDLDRLFCCTAYFIFGHNWNQVWSTFQTIPRRVNHHSNPDLLHSIRTF